MSDFKIDNLKGKLQGGGARANLFKTTFTGPFVNTVADLSSHLCKAAQLPGSVVGQIDVPYRGRVLKVAGDRTFENWTVTFINDEGFDIRDAFERWMNVINQHVEGEGSINPEDYQATMQVDQLSRNGDTAKTVVINGAFPVNISAIDLSYDTTDAIEEFTVEFAYQYWTSTGTTS